MSDKKERIIDSALELFTSRGFHNTPTSLIAKKAGVANGTLFNHFKSKEELINELYLTCKSSLISSISSALDNKLSFKDQLYNVWTNSLKWVMSKPNQFLFFQQYSNSPFIENETREQARERFAPFIIFLEEGKKNREIKGIPNELLIGAMLGTLSSTIEILKFNEEQNYNSQIIESAFNMIWDGIKT